LERGFFKSYAFIIALGGDLYPFGHEWLIRWPLPVPAWHPIQTSPDHPPTT